MSIDKLEKIGIENVKKEIVEKAGLTSTAANQILKIISIKGESEELIKIFKNKMSKIPEAQEGLSEIKEILDYLKTAGIDKKYYRFEPTIARGLAHYTGPIWEIMVIEGGVGSVAGCGRYDNVIGDYLGGNEKIPATGGSFGIERIMEILKDRKMANLPKSYINVLVTIFDENLAKKSIDIATQLRKAGITTILYPDVARLDKQLKYANSKEIPFVVIIGPEEVAKNQITLKNMKTGTQIKLKNEELLKKLKEIMK